ncbi:hypothetical protein H6B10_17550, partial [Gemmiger formicilis]|nr:hypothetical protein [Gemmiger formicilis]
YRLIDFTLSSMVNAGIDNVSVIVRKNYHSLMDHLGAGLNDRAAHHDGSFYRSTLFDGNAGEQDGVVDGTIDF